MPDLRIDINCDMGESWFDQTVGQDALLMPYISSCNLACGVHGGDPDTMRRAIALALQHNVSIGAHPSLPGQENFGRERVDLPPTELWDLLLTQVQRLLQAAQQFGATVNHLKPHGALYHLARSEPMEAEIIAKVCLETQIQYLFGPPDSELERAAAHFNLTFVPEGFVDRVYAGANALRSRKLPNAILHDSTAAADQAYRLAAEGVVVDDTGTLHHTTVKTLCVHGDHPEALHHLREIHRRFNAENVAIKAHHL